MPIVLNKLKGLLDNTFAPMLEGFWIIKFHFGVLIKLSRFKDETLRPVHKLIEWCDNNI